MRRAANGDVLIEISGPERASKADALATCLRDAIGGSAVVSRPVVKADMRITGFDDSVIKDEIITVITELGGCLASNIRIGPFRQMNNGLNMTWIQCPLFAALKVSRKGRVNLGWSIARAELMKARPVQCYKCWHFGHVRNSCNSSKDRTLSPHCVICADLGYESAHRLGFAACSVMA